MKFTIGTDPEMMLIWNDRYFSAIDILKADKYHRLESHGHEFYYDNVMAECAVKPASTKQEFIANLRQCFQDYAQIVKPYKLTIQASQDYPADQLLHKDARDVGCKAEFCAYRLDEIENMAANTCIKQTNFRTAGGHIHLGAKLLQEDDFARVFTVRMLDLFLGLPLMLLDRDPTASRRRKAYGLAGRHRKPDHGLEYRTPSNYWLTSPLLAGMVYDICQFVLDYFIKQGNWKCFWSVDDDWAEREDWANAHHCFGYDIAKLREAIDTLNITLGQDFLPIVKSHLPFHFGNFIVRQYNVVLRQKSFRYSENFYQEWGL